MEETKQLTIFKRNDNYNKRKFSPYFTIMMFKNLNKKYLNVEFRNNVDIPTIKKYGILECKKSNLSLKHNKYFDTLYIYKWEKYDELLSNSHIDKIIKPYFETKQLERKKNKNEII